MRRLASTRGRRRARDTVLGVLLLLLSCDHGAMAQDSDAGDLRAIDKLLAETDQGWDVEAQVLTLKQAAAAKPLAEHAAVAGEPPSASRHKLPIPTPFELAPGQIPASGDTA